MNTAVIQGQSGSPFGAKKAYCITTMLVMIQVQSNICALGAFR